MLLEKDVLLANRAKKPWGSFLSRFIAVGLVVLAAYCLTAIVLVSRSDFWACNVPLGPYAIVALLLMVPAFVLLLLINYCLNTAVKVGRV